MQKGFILYPHHWEIIKKLDTNSRAELLQAIFDYQLFGKTEELTPIVDIVFSMILEQFKIDAIKYDKICDRNKENIEKRWKNDEKKVKQPIPPYTRNTNNIRPYTRNTDNDKDNDKDNDNDNDKDNDIITTKVVAIAEAENKPIVYGNNEINDIIALLKKAVGITDFKESYTMQRKRAQNIRQLIAQIGKEDFLSRLKCILQDDFKAKNCNSIAYIHKELKAFIHSPIVETEPKGCRTLVI